jgi:hypothetical protein
MPYRQKEVMNEKRFRWAAVFQDVQFWVPLTVLLIGLLLLRIVR